MWTLWIRNCHDQWVRLLCQSPLMARSRRRLLLLLRKTKKRQSSLLEHTATCCNTLKSLCLSMFMGRSRRFLRRLQGTRKRRENSLLQHTAPCCNMLQHAATHCNHCASAFLWQSWGAVCCSCRGRWRGGWVVYCNTLQDTATRCNTLQTTAKYCKTLEPLYLHLLIAKSKCIPWFILSLWSVRQHSCALSPGEVGGGWGRVPFSRNLMSPTPRRKWYLTTGRRAH